jgi:hypothetical protein
MFCGEMMGSLWAGRGEEDKAKRGGRSAAGEVVCGLFREGIWAETDYFLLERVRALDVGRCELPAARCAGILQKR